MSYNELKLCSSSIDIDCPMNYVAKLRKSLTTLSEILVARLLSIVTVVHRDVLTTFVEVVVCQKSTSSWIRFCK